MECVKYTDEDSRASAIKDAEQRNLRLCEDSIRADGDYLFFEPIAGYEELDPEKVTLAEAIIALDARLTILEVKLNA